MKKFLITILCLAVVCGGGYFGYQKYQKNKDDKRIVDVVPIKLLSDGFWYSTYVEPFEARVVSSSTQTIGIDSQNVVKEIKVKLGDEVKKGDVIMVYDTTLLELETAQKKARIEVITQSIAKAEKELTRIKNLRPSEERPVYTYPTEPEPDYPEYPEYPSYEEPVPEEPAVELTDIIMSFDQAAWADNGVWYFNAGFHSIVTPQFMEALINQGRHAVINVYNENGKMLYCWDLNGVDDKMLTVHEWSVSNGVSVFDGMVSYDGSENGQCGNFFVYTGNDEVPEDPEPVPDDNFFYEEPDTGWNEAPEYYPPQTDSNDENYMYSRAELERKVRQQESAIKDLELDLRSANLDYEDSTKKVKDGKVVAKIDGVVTKIGEKTLSDDTGEDEFTEDGEPSDEENGGENDAAADISEFSTSYIIIRGDARTSLEIEVDELDLDKFSEGTRLTGVNYMNGEMFDAVVTGVRDEPERYSGYFWQKNPNNSLYIVDAVVEGSNSLTIDYWVSINPPEQEEEQDIGSSLYLPIWYLHKEGAGYYVMKADENGLLKKQYVRSGRIVYGEYVEIKGGISRNDLICFPYGKDVKEGVKTHETDKIVSIYEY